MSKLLTGRGRTACVSERAALLLITSLAILVLAGCGATGKPDPGYGDPCETPVAGVIDCPAAPVQPQSVETAADACRKLVECGVLADSFMANSGTGCENSSTCTGAGGECLLVVTQDGESMTCHYPTLDYWWCVRRLELASTLSNPCDDNARFTSEHVRQAVACIESTPCASLGLPFGTKRLSGCTPETAAGAACRTAMDKLTCADSTVEKPHSVWTATTCDFGMLRY